MADMITCPHCGENTSTASGFCDECGLELQSEPLKPVTAAMAMESGTLDVRTNCPYCGQQLRPNARHCPNCGKKLTSPTKAAATQEAPVTDTGVLHVGLVISDRYGLESVLGEGGMGRVWKAFDRNLGKYVVIKTIVAPDEGLRKALQAEAQFLINIRHQNIISVIDFFTIEQELCYVMEYVPGPSWADEIEEPVQRRLVQPMAAEEILLRVKGMLPAFEYLHSLKPPIIYCDFKPANIKRLKLPNGDTVEVLLDFGAAYLYDPDVPPKPARGTLGYHSPQAEHPDWRDDYFTLGRTIAEMAGMAEVREAEYMFKLTEPDKFPWNQYDESFYYFVSWLTEFERDDRPQSVREIEVQLDGVLGYVKGQKPGKTVSHRRGNFTGVTLDTMRLNAQTGVVNTTVKIDLPEIHVKNPASTILIAAQEAYQLRNITQALSLANQAVNNNGGAAAYVLRSLIHNQQGQNEQAEADLKEARQLQDPQVRWEMLLAEGQLLENAGKFDAAEKCYERMMALRPGDYRARLLLADLYRRSANYEQAIEAYQAIIQSRPAVGAAYIGASKAFLASKKTENAIKILEEVSSRNTSYNDVMLELIGLYNQTAMSGKEEGLAQAARAITILKENGVESRIFFRLVGEFYYTAYQFATKNGSIPKITFPNGQVQTMQQLSQANENAWREYLARDENADREAIINDRIMSARSWAWM
jgi:serine/threonine protein kinase